MTESGRRGDADWFIQEGTADDEFPGGTYFHNSAIDSEMNIIGFGTTYGDYAGTNADTDTGVYRSGDVIVAKFDPSGKRLWKRQIGSVEGDSGDPGIVTDSNDNIYLLTYVTNRASSFGGTSITYDYSTWVLIKYDKNGTLQWVKDLPSTNSTNNNSRPQDMVLEGNHIYLTGNTDNWTKGRVDKYDLDGNRVATRDVAFSFTSTLPRMASIAVNSSAVYLTTYTSSGNVSDLIKLPLDLSSQTLVQTATDMWFDEVDVLSNGNVVVLARDQNSDPVGAPIMRIFNSSGTQLSSGTKNQGNSNRTLHTHTNYDTLAIDSSDNIIWMQKMQQVEMNTFLLNMIPLETSSTKRGFQNTILVLEI